MQQIYAFFIDPSNFSKFSKLSTFLKKKELSIFLSLDHFQVKNFISRLHEKKKKRKIYRRHRTFERNFGSQVAGVSRTSKTPRTPQNFGMNLSAI